jgi:hypothetical protein
MAHITPEEMKLLSGSDAIKAMEPENIQVYIDGATSILDSYVFDQSKSGFSNAIKLASVLLVDHIAFSNIGGGAFNEERMRDIWYVRGDKGLSKKISEVEIILSAFIVSGGSVGNRRIRMHRMVRK